MNMKTRQQTLCLAPSLPSEVTEYKVVSNDYSMTFYIYSSLSFGSELSLLVFVTEIVAERSP